MMNGTHKNIFYSFLTLIFALALIFSSCSGSNKYRLSGETVGKKEITLRLVIYTPEGVKSEVLATRSGRFEHEGTVPATDKPVFIEIYTNDYKPLGLAMAQKGSEIDVTVDPAGFHGFRIKDRNNKGNDSFNAILNDWLLETDAVNNSSIEEFVARNSESPVAYAVLSTLYNARENPFRGAELLGSLSADARPLYYTGSFETLVGNISDYPERITEASLLCEADTMFRLVPENYRKILIVFTEDNEFRDDSIVPYLQKTGENAIKNKTLVLEQYLSIDTTMWRRKLKTDLRRMSRVSDDAEMNLDIDSQTKEIKRNWISVWAGPGVSAPFANRFHISQLPFYVVADSTGLIRYNGPSAVAASDTLASLK